MPGTNPYWITGGFLQPWHAENRDGFIKLEQRNITILYGCVSQGLGTTKFTNLFGWNRETVAWIFPFLRWNSEIHYCTSLGEKKIKGQANFGRFKFSWSPYMGKYQLVQTSCIKQILKFCLVCHAIIYMTVLLDSDWVRAVQLMCNTRANYTSFWIMIGWKTIKEYLWSNSWNN